jgi:hypothetical protein
MEVKYLQGINLEGHTVTELEGLVRRIKAVIAARKTEWKIGENAIFNFQGCVYNGTIIKVNRKSVVVRCRDEEYWVTGKALKSMIKGDRS